MASHTFRIPPDIFDRMKLAATKRGITVTDLILDPWRKEGDELEYVPSPDPKDHGPTHTTAVLVPRRSRTVAAPTFVLPEPRSPAELEHRIVGKRKRVPLAVTIRTEPETPGHHGPKARDKAPKAQPPSRVIGYANGEPVYARSADALKKR